MTNDPRGVKDFGASRHQFQNITGTFAKCQSPHGKFFRRRGYSGFEFNIPIEPVAPALVQEIGRIAAPMIL
jgi:hypothetical protein